MIKIRYDFILDVLKTIQNNINKYNRWRNFHYKSFIYFVVPCDCDLVYVTYIIRKFLKQIKKTRMNVTPIIIIFEDKIVDINIYPCKSNLSRILNVCQKHSTNWEELSKFIVSRLQKRDAAIIFSSKKDLESVFTKYKIKGLIIQIIIDTENFEIKYLKNKTKKR